MIRGSLLTFSLILVASCEQSGESKRSPIAKAPFGTSDTSPSGNNPFIGAGGTVPVAAGGSAGGGGGAGGANAALKALQAAVDKNTAITYNVDLKPLVDKYCISCHAGATAKAGLSLDTFAGVKEAVTKMENRVRNGTMPPKASELPDEAQLGLDDLETLLGLWKDDPSKLAEDPKDLDLNVTYSALVGPLTTDVCAKCHTGDTPPGDILLDTQSRLEENLDAALSSVSAGRMPPSLDSARRSRILSVLQTWKDDGTP